VRSQPARNPTLTRKNGALILAEVVLLLPADAVELIAHEIEHVIEQLDDVLLGGDTCGFVRHTGEVAESCRALEAGRRVAREVDQAERMGLVAIPQRDRFSGPLDSASANVAGSGRFVVSDRTRSS
jgi:hypothetical protein